MQVQPVTIATLVDPPDRSVNNTARPEVPKGSSESSPDTVKLQRQTDDEKNTVYRLVDDETGQVISQVPSEQVLNVADSIDQLIQQTMQKPKLDVQS